MGRPLDRFLAEAALACAFLLAIGQLVLIVGGGR